MIKKNVYDCTQPYPGICR